MNGAAKGAIIGGVFLAMLGGAGYGAYTLVADAGSGSGSGDVKGATTQSAKGSGPVTDQDAARTAKAFLDAWAAGDGAAAARLTNNPQAAQAAVADYRAKAFVSKAVITPGAATGTTVPFAVAAEITYEGATKPLAYDSKLTVVRGATSGKPVVDWQPSVIHPQLGKDEKLRAGAPAVPPVKAVDRNGAELTAEKYPSLRPVLDQLRQTYGAKAGGRAGAELWIEPAAQDAPKRTLLTLAEGEPGTLKTTLDAEVQAVAEKAVARFPEASVAAVKPSSGDILAIANHRKDGFNAAMEGARAPGSTMKIVTAAMLIDRGKAGADQPAECTKEASWGGRSFRNLNHFDLPADATFATGFARSCNTSFIKRIDDVRDDAALSKEAREVFGIGLDWKTGVRSADGKVPAATGAAAAAAYIGQGQITMNPLNVASLTATARTGRFHQPVIIAPDLDGRPIARAERGMKPAVAQQVVRMMKQTASSGTAAEVMGTVRGSDKGAKTGSAEVDGAGSPDSWFTGFNGDLAAAAMVEGGGHGGDAAGPIVAAVLNS
ncbi:penicillin-binding transpeptidase domain-containing protein [Streptomyces sp. NPDC090445]|uniref:penicillin-binding transpeptidase domain-containing protein n=1 Tax=Streptomyces sp. NPDC090445 TaxID=3365963 RepID=UPI0037FB4B4D